MSTLSKQVIFWSLIVIFIAYTIMVCTDGTSSRFDHSMSDQARSGKLIFQQKNCISCHQIYGLGGYMGPDLTNVISNPQKGESYARAFIKSGTQKMPDFKLKDDQIDDLIAFLGYLGQEGVYPPKNPQVTWYGMVKKKQPDE